LRIVGLISIPRLFAHCSLFNTFRFHPIGRIFPHLSRFSLIRNLVFRLWLSDSSAPKIACFDHPSVVIDPFIKHLHCLAPIAQSLASCAFRSFLQFSLLYVWEHEKFENSFEICLSIVSLVCVEYRSFHLLEFV
jgi:hypothetical protein